MKFVEFNTTSGAKAVLVDRISDVQEVRNSSGTQVSIQLDKTTSFLVTEAFSEVMNRIRIALLNP